MFSRGHKIITFWWFSNLLFNWIYFYQFGSSTKITQYTSTRKELANPTVPLVIPKFEFLTEKQRRKVKNHQKMMGFSVCRARTITVLPAVFSVSVFCWYQICWIFGISVGITRCVGKNFSYGLTKWQHITLITSPYFSPLFVLIHSHIDFWLCILFMFKCRQKSLVFFNKMIVITMHPLLSNLIKVLVQKLPVLLPGVIVS